MFGVKNEKTIWVLTELYYPVDTSTGYYMTKIAEHLADKGMNVNVLTTSMTYNDTQCKQSIKSESVNDVQIKRIKPFFNNKDSKIKRIINALYVSIVLSFKLLFLAKKNDSVLSVTNPIFLVLFLPIICRLRKLKYTLLVHDVFPENIFALSNVKKGGLLKSIFDWAYSKADNCIVIGRDMEKVINSKGNMHTHFIPIWSQIDQVFPLKKEESNIISKLNLSDKLVFSFAGNLGMAQGIENIIEGFNLCGIKKTHLLFIGGGVLENIVKKAVSEYSNIDLIGYQPRELQCDFLNACDVALVTLSKGMLGLGVPSKTYNILAAGKPILLVANSQSEIALLINEFKIGWVVEPDNPLLLANTIEQIFNSDIQDIFDMGIRARHIAETKFSETAVLNEYYKLLQ